MTLFFTASLALAVVLGTVLSQALLARARWVNERADGPVVGEGAYREAPVSRWRRRWLGLPIVVGAACTLSALWALVTLGFALAGTLLPPAWPVALSGYALVIVLFVASSKLARRTPDASRAVRFATTHSYLHHGAVLLTFGALATLGHDAWELFLVSAAACAVGVAVTALLHVAAHRDAESLAREGALDGLVA
ncbi:MAG: hypothetical protein K1X94_15225 [Sandaracinaceae bacterium]|nr:hypothetical protein [Sandaracinaceae bacterium]